MTDLIRRLTTWVSLLVTPRGRHRRTLLQPPTIPLLPQAPLPAHRSPYGLDTPLDATTARSVRPYVRELEAA